MSAVLEGIQGRVLRSEESRKLMTRTWSAVLARLDTPTGDGRIISSGGGSSRDLPLPLLYQRQTDDGHGGSVVVGRIETVQIGDGMVTATGSMLDDAGESALESLEAGVVGPSVDLDDIEYVMDDNERIIVTQWRIAGATLVAIPAFADVSITLDPLPAPDLLPLSEGEGPRVPQGEDDDCFFEYSADLTTFATVTRERMERAEVRPPIGWFLPPDLDRFTPLTISDSGRVFGHIAQWGQCHVGLPGCVTPPQSMSGYSYFTQGEQMTQEGAPVPVGTLVAGPRHADAQAAFRAAQEHYDDVSAAVAKVSAGEDEFGIWVAGWMLPSARPEAVEVFRSSPVSGDWRRIGGSLELIAVCSVNSGGFPPVRARVAFSSGAQRTLVGTFGVMPRQGEVRAREAGNDMADKARAAWARHEWKRIGS